MHGLTLKHERKVQILHPITSINVSVLGRHRHMIERQARPQQAAEYAHLACAFKLKTPRAYGDNILQAININDKKLSRHALARFMCCSVQSNVMRFAHKSQEVFTKKFSDLEVCSINVSQ